jgi:hypothetical protein
MEENLNSTESQKQLPKPEETIDSVYILAEELHRALLEGWRISALLLDQSVPGFNWRRCTLAFIQGDPRHRGKLNPHDVAEVEATRLRLDVTTSPVTEASPQLRIYEQTSLGAFAFRAVHRCNKAAEIEGLSVLGTKTGRPVAMPVALTVRKAASQACVNVNRSAFQSLEGVLSVYLTWLLHSEELKDLSVYHALKARIYNFRQADSKDQAAGGSHHLRCLLLLLLAHQFDCQLYHGDPRAEHLDWELKSLLRVLRENWKRGQLIPFEHDAHEALNRLGETEEERRALAAP